MKTRRGGPSVTLPDGHWPKTSRAFFIIEQIMKIVKIMKTKTFVDIGLPSGTLWAETNEEGVYNWNEANEKYPQQLPAHWQFCELADVCDWKWDEEKKGYTVTGPNGNSIFLPASGGYYDGSWYYVGSNGFYWSSTQSNSSNGYTLLFNGSNVSPSDSFNKSYYYFPVRLANTNFKKNG